MNRTGTLILVHGTGITGLIFIFNWTCPDCGTDNETRGSFVENLIYPKVRRDDLPDVLRKNMYGYVDNFFNPNLEKVHLVIGNRGTLFKTKK